MAAATEKSSKAADVKEQPPVQAPAIDPFAAPDGFTDETNAEIDGWFKAEVGRAIQGQLVGHVALADDEGKTRKIVLIKLALPCFCSVKDSEDLVELGKGKVVGFSVTHDTSKILEYVEKKGHVKLVPREQVKLKKSRKMWKFTQYYKGTKGVVPRFELGTSGGDDDDIPF